MCTLMGPRWRLLYPGGRLGRRDARVWSAQGLQRQCCRVDAQECLKSVGTQPGEGQAPRVGGPAGLGPTENPLGWAALVGGLRGHGARGGLADDDQLPQQANVSTPQGTVGTADLCTLFRVFRFSPAPYPLPSEPAGSQESLLAIGLSMIIQLIGHSRIITLPANCIS